MRGSTVRILDDKYTEFIEALQSLGELQNTVRLIARLSDTYRRLDDADCHIREMEAGAAMRTLWENGWIEVCVAKRQSKGSLKRTYTLRINLEKIACYFKKERVQRAMLAGKQETWALS